MKAQADTQHIDSILEPWQATIGRDYDGYRNHVVRMATFCLMLKPCSPQEQWRIEIAACFHDIGIWTADTLDYLQPSVPPALSYLDAQGLSDWGPEITEMILEHHRVREITDGLTPLFEVFRKGDLVDFSKGWCGLAFRDRWSETSCRLTRTQDFTGCSSRLPGSGLLNTPSIQCR